MNPSPLSVELERALLGALHSAWSELNASHFKRRLRPPELRLSDSAARLGQWRPEGRVLELSRRLCVERPWGLVVEVLKHEMAHQYVSEALGAVEEQAHGPLFQELCRRLRIDAAASGLPDEVAEGAPAEAQGRLLGRIARLLALAESQNRHEAELAMAEAQRLMLKHNIEQVGQGAYVFRHLGEPKGRTTEAERLLALLLGEYFFVEVIWVPVWRAREGRRGSVLEVCGAPVNVEMAEHVHGFLLRTAERLWRDWKRAAGLKSDRERQTFLAGVMGGFGEKLAAERARHRQEGLVWVGDQDLRDFYRARHPRIAWTRYRGRERTEAHGAGRAAGRDIVLHRPVSTTTQAGRLLTTSKR